MSKKSIIILTAIVTVLCLYNLSFTWIASNVQEEANVAATDSKGQVNLNKKQKYMDSIYHEPVINVLGMEYTYKEIKEKELSLGLDLQGGMHVVLEVSPIEILKALAGNNAKTPEFQMALKKAQEAQRNSQENFTTLFYNAYEEANPGKGLKAVFANSFTREKGLKGNESDADFKKVIDNEVEGAISRAEKILRTRIDKFGVISPNINRMQGSGRIQLELPGVENPQRVRNLLQGVAQLEFMPVYFFEEIDPYIGKMNDYLLSIEKPGSVKATTDTASKADNKLFTDSKSDSTKTLASADSTKEDSATTASNDKAKTDSTQKAQLSSFLSLRDKDKPGFFYKKKDTARINSILAMERIQSIIPSSMRFLWEKPKKAKNANEEVSLQLIVVKDQKGKKLAGDVVTNARVETDAAKGGMVQVAMTMNDAGSKQWRQMTKDATQEKSRFEGNRRVAIVLDDIVYSAPEVQSEIPNGQSVISGNFDLEEATDLSNILEAGKLPAPVRIVEEVVIGPSLGKEAISQGLNSMLVGLSIVVLFMIFYYNKGGFVADIALLFNILFILGVMANFNAVLTLPGIAGIVLTIGMAVDANVLIFERIREELTGGRSIKEAIELGYDKAFSSIFDSNVTILISGACLYWLGSGPVQGFAITLIIGILTSFFTSVFISKVIVQWMTKDKDVKSISFSTIISRNLFKNFNYDVIGKRKIAYVFSSLVIVTGIIAIITQGGLNLGVDFKGGRSYIIEFKEPVEAAELREKIAPSFENKGTEVKSYGSNYKMKITTSYLIDDESAEADDKVMTSLVTGLKSFAGDKFEVQSSTKVGASVADDIVKDSIWAILLSLIGIFIYVFIRFRNVTFSLGGVVALLHDALFVIAMFAILRWFGIAYEIDQVFVAAILTIVGFSINDTVVVFDRVREFMAENTKMPLAQVLNSAINHTFSRTIITAFTVFIVVAILVIFGGEVLRSFSVAMLIGIFAGSYSTIFIAVPIVLDFAKKEDLNNDKPTLVETESVNKVVQ